MKKVVGRFAVSVWIGFFPGALFGFQIDTWQWWVVMLVTNGLIFVSEECRDWRKK